MFEVNILLLLVLVGKFSFENGGKQLESLLCCSRYGNVAQQPLKKKKKSNVMIVTKGRYRALRANSRMG